MKSWQKTHLSMTRQATSKSMMSSAAQSVLSDIVSEFVPHPFTSGTRSQGAWWLSLPGAWNAGPAWSPATMGR
jgi:hypothetical protein